MREMSQSKGNSPLLLRFHYSSNMYSWLQFLLPLFVVYVINGVNPLSRLP